MAKGVGVGADAADGREQLDATASLAAPRRAVVAGEMCTRLTEGLNGRVMTIILSLVRHHI